uniref:Uncharacterized protein n=1 Tax=Astyanax mexicanus TaxID=7994 RepID=A0A3B1K7I7_ASTMX
MLFCSLIKERKGKKRPAFQHKNLIPIVWTCFAASSIEQLAFIDGTMSSKLYPRILKIA